MSSRNGPRRVAALGALWRAVAAGSTRGGPAIGDRLRSLPRLASAALAGRYPLGWGRLTLVALAVAYLLSPVDLMPEALLTVFGLGDDALVALWLGGAFLVETDRYLEWERAEPMVVEALPA